ncbi:unnamed protein product, partial [Adineta ricciae]
MFGASVVPRFLSIALTVGLIGAVIVAVAIVGRETPAVKPVFGSDMHVILDLPIAAYELDLFFDPRATLADFIESLNTVFMSAFPDSCLKVVITGFSIKPIIVIDTSNNMDQTKRDTPSIVVLHGSVYFTEAKTAEQIRMTLTDYTRLIILINKYTGKPSERLSTINMQRSTFTDAILIEITVYRARQLRDITIDIIQPVPDLVPEPVSSGTSTILPSSLARACNHFVPAYMSVTFERLLTAMEQHSFADPVSVLHDLAITVQNKIFSTFSISFV